MRAFKNCSLTLSKTRSSISLESLQKDEYLRIEMSQRNFFAELKRPNVYKVAVAYAVVAWLLIQIATSTFPVLEIPVWATRLVIVLVALGFPIALIFAWAFELTPEGIKRTEDVAPGESLPRRTGRKLTAVITALAVIAAGLLALQLFQRSAGKPVDLEKSIAVLPFQNLSDDKANAPAVTPLYHRQPSAGKDNGPCHPS